MLPLSAEYAGSICELKTMENELLTVCRIIKIDHNALELAAGNDGRIPLIRYRQSVKIIVHHAKLTDQILVGSVYLSTNTFMRLEDVRPLSDFERRGAFRVNIGIEGKLFPFLSEAQQREFDELVAEADPEDAARLIEESYTVVQVMDLSLTGTRLKSNRKLRIGEKYYLEFEVLGQRKYFGLSVQRIIDMPDRTVQFGCSFFDMSERVVDDLCRDLFQLQRIEKQRRANNSI